jgi:hypothetical protein
MPNNITPLICDGHPVKKHAKAFQQLASHNEHYPHSTCTASAYLQEKKRGRR